jgi:hypothetical protein
VPNADVWAELKDGTGLLRLRLDWEGAASNGSNGVNGAHGSPAAVKPKHRSPSVSSKSVTNSPSRFSMALTPKKKDKEQGGGA